MPWNFGGYAGQQGGRSGGDQSLDQRLLLMERRLKLLEQVANSPSTAASDFVAHEGETIVVQGPTTGITGLLPAATATNRGAVVTLVFQNTNKVKLRCVNGTVNGQATLERAVVGAYAAVSDGSTGWWLESLNLPRPRDVHLQDYFVSGDNTTGQIGSLGWSLLGLGTPVAARASANLQSSSKIALTTSAAANDRTVLSLGSAEGTTVVNPSEVSIVQAVWNFNNNLTLKRGFFGMASTLATAPASVVDGLGILYDSSVGGNYLSLARVSSAGSPVDTGAAVPANTGELLTLWQSSPGTWRFYVGERHVGTVSGTAAPTAAMNVGFRIETLTTAAKTVRVGYFGLRAMSLAAAFDDDDFLKS